MRHIEIVTRTSDTWHAEGAVGSRICEVLEEAVQVATEARVKVSLNFNGCRIVAEEGSSAAQLEARLQHRIRQAAQEWRESEEAREWRDSDVGKTWCESEEARDWRESESGKAWRESAAGMTFIANQLTAAQVDGGPATAVLDKGQQLLGRTTGKP